ncbi:hypothetical protein Lalb_Chr14g0368321 [Lupinus albus]|uniref:Uncharacterized protein n=1 Tax=Lupinus albus TaxID=3870 RepID=A0A6A4PEP1_LUPAL|nr:hypothetical protein Lalb_Chr14g0368321 [Lupinus albus]
MESNFCFVVFKLRHTNIMKMTLVSQPKYYMFILTSNNKHITLWISLWQKRS